MTGYCYHNDIFHKIMIINDFEFSPKINGNVIYSKNDINIEIIYTGVILHPILFRIKSGEFVFESKINRISYEFLMKIKDIIKLDEKFIINYYNQLISTEDMKKFGFNVNTVDLLEYKTSYKSNNDIISIQSSYNKSSGRFIHDISFNNIIVNNNYLTENQIATLSIIDSFINNVFMESE